MGLFRKERAFVPAHAGQLTTEWLTTALTESGTITAPTQVVSFVAERLDLSEAQAVGELSKIHLAYHPPKAGPDSAIAKFPSQNDHVKGAMEAHDAYAREIAFYTDLAHIAPIRIPAHYGSSLDPGRSKEHRHKPHLAEYLPARLQLTFTHDPNKPPKPTERRYALLLEDLSADAALYHAAKPPSPDLIRVGLDTLAHLHGAYWNHKDTLKNHPATGHLFTHTPHRLANELRLRTFDLARERWADWWTHNDTVTVLLAASSTVTDVEIVNQHYTLVHGDPRAENFIYSASQSQPPALVDWEMPALGHPGWDVATLLGTSLEPDQTDAANDIIAEYHRILIDWDCKISETELRNGIKAGLRSRLIHTVMAVRGLNDADDAADDNVDCSTDARDNDDNDDSVDTNIDAIRKSTYDLWAPRLLALLQTR